MKEPSTEVTNWPSDIPVGSGLSSVSSSSESQSSPVEERQAMLELTEEDLEMIWKILLQKFQTVQGERGAGYILKNLSRIMEELERGAIPQEMADMGWTVADMQSGKPLPPTTVSRTRRILHHVSVLMVLIFVSCLLAVIILALAHFLSEHSYLSLDLASVLFVIGFILVLLIGSMFTWDLISQERDDGEYKD